MRKGPTIIQISGFKGMFLAVFTVICLGAGFVVFPSKVAMYLWNSFAPEYGLPEIVLWQGLLLWVFVALSFYMLTGKKRNLISFSQPLELSEDEMRVLMQRIKMQKQAQKLNTMFIKAEDLKVMTKEGENTSEQDKNIHKS